jgi:hypothetical protein
VSPPTSSSSPETRGPEPACEPGDVVVGRYLVRERVGAGRLGVIHRAEDLTTREDVALRVIWPDLLPDDAARGRFLRAATPARALASRYVGVVRDAFVHEAGGQTVCAMVATFLRDPTLAVRIAQRLRYQAPLMPVEVQPIVSQLGIGLSAIHRAGLVHGNLKAHNVFFEGDEVRIGDLGLAAALPGGLRATVASDVHALAELTAEMLGLGPDGRGEGAPDLPPAVRATLARALSRHSRERFPDVDGLAAALLTAFERGERGDGASPAPRPARSTPPLAEGGLVHASGGEDSAFVAGALLVEPAATAPRLSVAAAQQRRGPSVLLDIEALASRTPVTAPPRPRTPPPTPRPAAAPPTWRQQAGGTPPPFGVHVPAPAPLAVPAAPPAAARRARVPVWLALVVVIGGASLVLALVHNVIDARLAEEVAAARVEKARVLARLRQETAAPPPPHAAPAAPPPAASAPGSCPTGMHPVAGAAPACIAAYEYPGRAVQPRVAVTLAEARALCAEAGARLCRQAEWIAACEGKEARAFPYGARALRAQCNTAETGDALHGLERGGRFPSCRTPGGVFDLVGNAGEWVEEGVVMGGDAHTRTIHARCRSAAPADPNRRSPLVGLRCCSD